MNCFYMDSTGIPVFWDSEPADTWTIQYDDTKAREHARQRYLTEKSQMITVEIGRRKEKLRLNTKGWQRAQYFNKCPA